METIPITVNGAKVLEDELLKLKDEVRPRIVNDIATAREHGGSHFSKGPLAFAVAAVAPILLLAVAVSRIDWRSNNRLWCYSHC